MAQERGSDGRQAEESTRRRSRPRSPWPPSRGTGRSTSWPASYGVHPTLIHGWKKQLLAGAEGIFGSPAKAASADAEARQAELFEQIGRLKMELEWLKKKSAAFG